ncbi:MAG: cysteine hydrolase [Polyangiaceae bacterium]|nr:cysteine hydrolase [Polyangiaceae bacterium]
MNDETAMADLLAFVLAGRKESLTDAAFPQMPPELQAAIGSVAETIAALGLAEAPVAPSTELRARILESWRARRAIRPRKALLVCDMIVDHLTPGHCMEVPRARAIVPAVARRIVEARALGTPVVYVVDRHAPDDPELEEYGLHAVEGSPGAEVWPDLAPRPGDSIVPKPSYSGFYATELQTVLDAIEVDTLVLTGCATEVQLLTTAMDALERGFAVELPADSHAGMTEVGERVAAGLFAALSPYAPARRARLARLAGHG